MGDIERSFDLERSAQIQWKCWESVVFFFRLYQSPMFIKNTYEVT